MINKKGERYELICDACGVTVEEIESFDEAVEFKKENEWRSHQFRTGEWEDLCPECGEE